MSSSVEVEIAALFMNTKLEGPMQQALIEMSHLQPLTKIKTDNNTAEENINEKIIQNKSNAIKIRFYWLKCRQAQK